MQICAGGTFSTGDYGYYTTGVDMEDRVIELYPADLAFLEGNWPAAALLARILRWQSCSAHPGGWFFKTRAEWRRELCLSIWQLRSALDLLRRKDYLEMRLGKVHGAPTTWFHLHWEVLAPAYREFLRRSHEEAEVREEGGEAPSPSDGENLPMEMEDFSQSSFNDLRFKEQRTKDMEGHSSFPKEPLEGRNGGEKDAGRREDPFDPARRWLGPKYADWLDREAEARGASRCGSEDSA